MSSPISPAKAARENLSFRDRVMRLRKAYDLFPWIEVQSKVWERTTSLSDPVQQHTFTLKVPRNLFVSEVVHLNHVWGVDPAGTNLNLTGLIQWDAQLTVGVAQETLVTSPVNAEQFFGWLDEELKRFPTGMRIPALAVASVLARTQPAGSAGPYPTDKWAHTLWLGWRGYQLRKKGTHITPQFTYAEYNRNGYVAQPFSPVLAATLKSDGTETPAEFTLPQLHATDYFSLRFFNSGAVANPATVLVKIEPPNNQPLMDDFVPAPLLGHVLNRVAWYQPQPLSCPQGGIWRMRVKNARAHTYPGPPVAPQLVLVLHGHNLVRQ